MRKIFIIFISMLFIRGVAYCNTRLLLHQSVNVNERGLLLQDIASFDGNQDLIRSIKGMEIPSDVYSDGFIDKKELYTLLKARSSELFFIYGSAVRVMRCSEVSNNSAYGMNEYIVKKGDRVNFIIKKNGIHIELSAVVLDDGRIEDEVTVNPERKTGHSLKIFKGRVKSRDIIEAVL